MLTLQFAVTGVPVLPSCIQRLRVVELCNFARMHSIRHWSREQGMTKGITAFLFIMFIAVTSSAGETNHDGAYSSHDSSGQKRNSILPPVVNEKYDYYEICGCCEKDLQCELSEKCIRSSDGRKYDSTTDWKLKWDYRHRRDREVCFADSFLVTVDITFHLPKWAHSKYAPRSLVDKWEKYVKNLATHEQRHHDIAVEAAKGLTRAVGELPPAGTCRELDRNVQELARERMNKLIEDQKEYDTVTNHGSTEGAVFP